MLACVCSVEDHRRHQNVLRTSVTHTAFTSCTSFIVLTTFWCHQWSTDYWKHGIYGENCDEHRRKSIWSWCTLSRVLWLSVNYAQSPAWYRSCDTSMVLFFMTIRTIHIERLQPACDIFRNAKLYDNGWEIRRACLNKYTAKVKTTHVVQWLCQRFTTKRGGGGVVEDGLFFFLSNRPF